MGHQPIRCESFELSAYKIPGTLITSPAREYRCLICKRRRTVTLAGRKARKNSDIYICNGIYVRAQRRLENETAKSSTLYKKPTDEPINFQAKIVVEIPYYGFRELRPEEVA